MTEANASTPFSMEKLEKLVQDGGLTLNGLVELAACIAFTTDKEHLVESQGCDVFGKLTISDFDNVTFGDLNLIAEIFDDCKHGITFYFN